MEDAKIIELFFQRNEQAVKETDTAYGRKLYVLSNNILNNREDAEESVSDTYMETWNSIPPKRPKYFYAFLASVCRNVSFNRLDWRLAAKRNAEVEKKGVLCFSPISVICFAISLERAKVLST